MPSDGPIGAAQASRPAKASLYSARCAACKKRFNYNGNGKPLCTMCAMTARHEEAKERIAREKTNAQTRTIPPPYYRRKLASMTETTVRSDKPVAPDHGHTSQSNHNHTSQSNAEQPISHTRRSKLTRADIALRPFLSAPRKAPPKKENAVRPSQSRAETRPASRAAPSDFPASSRHQFTFGDYDDDYRDDNRPVKSDLPQQPESQRESRPHATRFGPGGTAGDRDWVMPAKETVNPKRLKTFKSTHSPAGSSGSKSQSNAGKKENKPIGVSFEASQDTANKITNLITDFNSIKLDPGIFSHPRPILRFQPSVPFVPCISPLPAIGSALHPRSIEAKRQAHYQRICHARKPTGIDAILASNRPSRKSLQCPPPAERLQKSTVRGGRKSRYGLVVDVTPRNGEKSRKRKRRSSDLGEIVCGNSEAQAGNWTFLRKERT